MYTKDSLAQEIVNKYGPHGLDIVLTVYVNFYESELEIMNLCAKWVPLRRDLREKGYLLKHASDEVVHAQLFREGIERLGIAWNELNPDNYRVPDISERFRKLHQSDDELEVLLGLNLYAEGVLALEEIEQLARMKPEYFHEFSRILRDEKTHVAFGATVAKRLIGESETNRKRAQEHCDWYQDHMERYLRDDLADALAWGVHNGFITDDYVARTRARFRDVMSGLGLRVTV
jgi:1,2-phenylacetyl-CoA epoxidase catalytic subunit